MSIISEGLNRARQEGPLDAFLAASAFVSRRLHIAFHNRAYYLHPYAKKRSSLPVCNDAKIVDDLQSLGITILPYTLDLEGFHHWQEEAAFPSYFIADYASCDRWWPNIFAEKALEYYLSSALLDLDETDTFVDVGAHYSPWYEMAERLYGCRSYALDLRFPHGMHSGRIGADATDMPLSRGFATKIALHSAFECFEGSADRRFIPEAHRVLRDDGKMVIVPLQLDHFNYVLLSPTKDRRGGDNQQAEVVWEDTGWPSGFAWEGMRFYSAEAFWSRIVKGLTGFKLTVYHIENAPAVSPDIEWPRYYTRFAALFERQPDLCDAERGNTHS